MLGLEEVKITREKGIHLTWEIKNGKQDRLLRLEEH
jgi:hypothetical protein